MVSLALWFFKKGAVLAVIATIALGVLFFVIATFSNENKVWAIPEGGIPAPGDPPPRVEARPQMPKEPAKSVLIMPNGNRYEGDIVDGNFHGKGIYTWANGDRYEGDFIDNKRNGKGVYSWADGKRFDGNWVDDKQNGKGLHTWADGRRYEGDWSDGKRNGKGVLTFANGNRYEGDFVDDKQTGKGVYTHADGKREEGYFIDGELQQSVPLYKLNLTKLPDGRKTWESDDLTLLEIPKGISVYYWGSNGIRFHIDQTGGLIQAHRVLIYEKINVGR